MSTTYIVRVNGVITDSRTSDSMHYTHANVRKDGVAFSWHLTEAAARKAASRDGNRVVAVEAHEGGKAAVLKRLAKAEDKVIEVEAEVLQAERAEKSRTVELPSPVFGTDKELAAAKTAAKSSRKAPTAGPVFYEDGSAVPTKVREAEARKQAAKAPTVTEMRRAIVATGELTRDQANALKGEGLVESYRNLVEAAPAKAPAKAAAKAPAKATKSAKQVQAERTANLAKAREAAKAAAAAPAPEVDGIKWGTSGAVHQLKEGDKFLFHGADRKAPDAKGVKVTMKIADRIWITGVNAKGVELVRFHIGAKVWARKA